MKSLAKVLLALFFAFMAYGCLFVNKDCGSLFVGVICAIVSISIFISIHNEPIKPKGT